jgi:hypothetical protein
VCGDDNATYPNACVAGCAGVEVKRVGACTTCDARRRGRMPLQPGMYCSGVTQRHEDLSEFLGEMFAMERGRVGEGVEPKSSFIPRDAPSDLVGITAAAVLNALSIRSNASHLSVLPPSSHLVTNHVPVQSADAQGKPPWHCGIACASICPFVYLDYMRLHLSVCLSRLHAHRAGAAAEPTPALAFQLKKLALAVVGCADGEGASLSISGAAPGALLRVFSSAQPLALGADAFGPDALKFDSPR